MPERLGVDPTYVRYGYTLADIDRLARVACSRDRSFASDAHTRYTVAWSAIAERLCAADIAPNDQELIRAGWQAIYAEVRQMRHTFGQARDDPNARVASKPRAVQYWHTPPVDPAADLIDRIATMQIMATLSPAARDAVVALGVHDDYQRAADALGVKYGCLTARLMEARRQFRGLWFAPDAAPRITGRDARRGTAPLMTHCPAGHELVAENVYVRPGPKKERRCRICECARGAARLAARRRAREAVGSEEAS